MSWKRILVPTDFSAASFAALKYAAKIADPKTTEVILLNVIEPIVYAPNAYGYAVADLGAVLQEQERAAQVQLEGLGRRWRKRLPKLRTVRLTGSPATSVVAAATKLKADVIVVATHGRTGLPHLFLGSVAERIVRTARCPVLTVRATARVKRPRVGRRPPRKTGVARAA